MKEFASIADSTLGAVDDAGKHSESVWREFFSFFRSHLIFSVDELMRLGREMKEIATSSAEFGEEVHNLSEASGMSAEQVSGLMFAFKETGANADTLNRGLCEMARNLSPLASSGSEGTKALNALGISAFEAGGRMKPLHEILLQIADRFHKMPDSTEKAAAAAIFGTRVGEDMIPVLNRGIAGIVALEKEAEELGVTLNDADAKALAQQAEELKIVDARWEGVKLPLSKYVLPGMIDLASAITGDTTALKILDHEFKFAINGIADGIERLLGWFIGLGSHGHDPIAHWFKHLADDRKKAIVQQETDILILRDQQKQLAELLEGGVKGKGGVPDFNLGPTASHADSLASMLQREKEDVQAFSDSTQSSMRQIDLSYQHQVDSATKAIEADRQLLARKKITLAEEKREEQEYSEFLASALKLRDEKWNEELDKIRTRVQKISADITQQNQEAHEELGKQLQGSLPQGPQSNPFTNPAFLQGQQILFEQAMKAVPALSAEKSALFDLRGALAGVSDEMNNYTSLGAAATAMMQNFGNAMAKNVAAAIVYGDNVPQAMARAAKGAIESIAAQDAVKALDAAAEGVWFLAQAIFFDDPKAAAAAESDFEAAAMFGAIGGAAAAVGAAIPVGGGGRGRGGSGSSRYRGGAASGEPHGSGSDEWQYGAMSSMGQTLAPGAERPSGVGNLTVSIMGDEQAGQWLATTLNRATTQNGVQLISTSSQRGAPVGH